jgi:hypothetical protein
LTFAPISTALRGIKNDGQAISRTTETSRREGVRICPSQAATGTDTTASGEEEVIELRNERLTRDQSSGSHFTRVGSSIMDARFLAFCRSTRH